MKVDFNPNYNQSFGELFPPTEKQLQRLGKYYIDEYNKALPQIKKMAEDVDIHIGCRKGITKLDRGFEYTVTRKLGDVGSLVNKFLNLVFVFESGWALSFSEIFSKKSLSEILVKKIADAKEMVVGNAKNSK